MRFVISFFMILIVWPGGAPKADIVWDYPFNDLSGEWSNNGRWYQSADSAWIHRDRFLPGASGPETKSLVYSTLTVPAGVDSLTIDLEQSYSLTGYAISGGWGASIAFSATVDGSDSHIIFYDSATGRSAGWIGFTDGHIQYTLPASAGQSVNLYFRAFTDVWGTISEAHLNWVFWEMTLTGHMPVSLENTTWAAIKQIR